MDTSSEYAHVRVDGASGSRTAGGTAGICIAGPYVRQFDGPCGSNESTADRKATITIVTTCWTREQCLFLYETVEVPRPRER